MKNLNFDYSTPKNIEIVNISINATRFINKECVWSYCKEIVGTYKFMNSVKHVLY